MAKFVWGHSQITFKFGFSGVTLECEKSTVDVQSNTARTKPHIPLRVKKTPFMIGLMTETSKYW